MHFKLLIEIWTVCDLIGTCFICNAPFELFVACCILACSDMLQICHLVLEPSTCFFYGCTPYPLGGSVCLLYPFLIWDTVRTEPSSIAPGEAAQGQQRAARRPTGKPQNLSEAWFGSVSKSWDAFLKLIQTYLRLFGLGIGLKPRRIVTCYFLIPSPAFLCLLVLAKLRLQRKIVIHGGTQ